MNWLYKIIYGLKDEQINSLSLERDGLESQCSILKRERDDALQNVESLKEQIRKFTESKLLEVYDLKDYYENKYGNTPYLYDFDGAGKRDAKLCLRVSHDGENVLSSAAQQLIKIYSLQEGEDPQFVVEAVMTYFENPDNWKYKTDQQEFGKSEFWNLAENSWVRREGDCDDLAILMHSLIQYVFVELEIQDHYWRVKLDDANTLLGRHLLNIFLWKDYEWYAVESTMDLAGSMSKTWLETPIKNNNLYSSHNGFIRRDRSWAANTQSLIPYKEQKNGE
jgi:hypothetical protein